MTPLLAIFQSLGQSLGMTLLHACWQGAVIAGLYAAALRLVPKSRPDTRYVLGLSALLAIAIAGIVTFGYELSHRLTGDTPAGGFDAIAGVPAVTPLSHWLPMLDALWLGGVALLSLRMAGGLWTIRQLSAQALDVPEAVRRRFDAALDRAGLAGRVRVRLNPNIDGPFIVGIARAVVYLPLSAITALTPDQLDAVFAHELAHVRRADYAWNLLQTVIETLFFFHPAVWWIGRCLREQRELCCDDVALAACRDPLTYATALLSLEEQRRAPNSGGHLAMALNGQGSGRSLLSRITRILGDDPDKTAPKKSGRSTALIPLALPVVLLTAVAALLPMSHVAARPQTNPTPVTTQTSQVPAPQVTEAAAPTGTNGEDGTTADASATDAPATDEKPAAVATADDVAPDEGTWNFVRDSAHAQAQAGQVQPGQIQYDQAQVDAAKAGQIEYDKAQVDEAKADYAHNMAQIQHLDAKALAKLAADARQEALAELSRHKVDIQRAEADARQASTQIQAQAKLEAQHQIDMAKVQIEARQADLTDAEKRKLQADAQRVAAEARAEFSDDWSRKAKAWAKSWKQGVVPPAPPAPAAPPAAPAPSAPAASPAPAAAPAPAAPAVTPVVALMPAPLMKPVKVMIKFAKPCKAMNAKVEVKTLVRDIRIVTPTDKVMRLDLKRPVVTIDTRVEINAAGHTVTE